MIILIINAGTGCINQRSWIGYQTTWHQLPVFVYLNAMGTTLTSGDHATGAVQEVFQDRKQGPSGGRCVFRLASWASAAWGLGFISLPKWQGASLYLSFLCNWLNNKVIFSENTACSPVRAANPPSPKSVSSVSLCYCLQLFLLFVLLSSPSLRGKNHTHQRKKKRERDSEKTESWTF